MKISCFILRTNDDSMQETIKSLLENSLVDEIQIVENLQSTDTLRLIAAETAGDYTLIYTKPTPLAMGQFAVERMLQVADDTRAGLLYTDYYQQQNGALKPLPLIDYQTGSLRDDFNFGSVLLYRTDALKEAVSEMNTNYQFAALYDLRLRVSQRYEIFHLNEFLYTEIEEDARRSGEKQFDYVDPRNRVVQIEMEQACTEHLKAIGAYLEPNFKAINFSENNFPVEASVIIPVYNRVRTIADAIRSVLSQQADFQFNIIVVDNHSTDGTTEIINQLSTENQQIIHIVPTRKDLGIGGCWNEGILHPQCGKFAVQLDSDDVYASEKTLQKIVEAFYKQQCAMVIGSYTMTNFEMQTIAPGLIDHREWTPENGRNNALRINGLGAPRAFYTPLLRELKLPNTSYGEDYAMGLRISREYQIGRIYESLYLCRRWEENSDAALDIARLNAYNLYKDRLRTVEVLARKNINQ
ncbi:MAG: glycosyltransferase family 2 protein [Prevotellaceae bacterium]|jgi:hypothetical protein|nr:glycosyltransferase family 2 protein [Prevotellaceae bacterium]